MDSNFRTLRDNGELKKLIKYLDNSSEQEKVWIATHLLIYNEGFSKQILTQIAEGDSMVAFTARMTLDEWEKGNLTYLVE